MKPLTRFFSLLTVSVFVFRPGENMMPTDFELNLVINNLQELMYTASDISHDRCVKVLTARAKVWCTCVCIQGFLWKRINLKM